MVKDLPFYKLNLCWDIGKNTEFLRNFMNKFETMENKIEKIPKIAIDITFDIANILNTEIGIIYSMNKFATNLYENLLKGVSVENISLELENLIQKNNKIIEEFNIFIQQLKEKEIFEQKMSTSAKPEINIEFAKEDNYKLSFVEYAQEEYKQLIK